MSNDKPENKNIQGGQNSSSQPSFTIQRIYIKDLSFESPSVPNIFQEAWKPEIHLDVGTKSEKVKEDLHEVVLTLTVKAKMDEKDVFLIEIHQAGLFQIFGIAEEQLKRTLGAFCPTVLFPYARAAIADVVTRGGFPQLNLAPLNFDAIYDQYVLQQKKAQDAVKH